MAGTILMDTAIQYSDSVSRRMLQTVRYGIALPDGSYDHKRTTMVYNTNIEDLVVKKFFHIAVKDGPVVVTIGNDGDSVDITVTATLTITAECTITLSSQAGPNDVQPSVEYILS